MNTYRVVTHVHSSWSYDGSWSIADLSNIFSKFGVHILMMAEHSQKFDKRNIEKYIKECELASTDKLRVLPGIEYSTSKNLIHILTWGIEDFLDEELPVNEILDAVSSGNGMSIFAHPARRDVWKLFDEKWVARLYGMEIWNRKTDSLARSEEAHTIIKKYHLKPIVSLDFHNKKQLYPLYNQLNCKENIFQLSNCELVNTIRNSTLKPKIFGLPADCSNSVASQSTHVACLGLQHLHRMLFRSQ